MSLYERGSWVGVCLMLAIFCFSVAAVAPPEDIEALWTFLALGSVLSLFTLYLHTNGETP